MFEKIHNQSIKGIIQVTAGNIAILFSKTFLWLAVPKVLGVIEYGYYKQFSLYLVYALLLHFGFPDGILLVHGGQDYQAINKRDLRLNTRFFFAFQGIVFLTVIVVSGVLFSNNRYILVMVCIDAFFQNIASYYKYVSQATLRFKEQSMRDILYAALQIGSFIIFTILLGLNVLPANGEIYILICVGIDFIILLWYIARYWEITIGKASLLKNNIKKIKRYFEDGILLTLAFQTTHLVFVLDRQMVDILFDIETYSLYSFAYSITVMISTMLGALATVLFPTLKRWTVDDTVKKFPLLLGGVTGLAFLLLGTYYPMEYFISWILPDYIGALYYLKIIMPGIAVSCCINLIIFTYFKILDELRQYLFISIAILFVGIVLNIIGFYTVYSPLAFSVASIATLLIWYLITVIFLAKKYSAEWKHNFIYLCMQLIAFYIITLNVSNGIRGMILYFFVYVLITYVVYRHNISIKLKKG